MSEVTELRNFINHYCELSPQQLDFVVSKFSTRLVKKHKHILKPGQICRELIYNVNGSFRHYYKDKNEKETTTWIVFDDMIATELASFIPLQPSRFYVEAMADSEINSISKEDLEMLYSKIPAFQQFGRKIAEEVVVGAINRVVSHLNETATQRYEKLLQRSEYVQKIPLKYLASFLGVTNTSLSRIRKQKTKY